MAVALTFGDSAVYNMDSKQVATIIKVYGGRLAMTCPYCNNEMEQGIIQSPHELSWKRGTKRPVLGRAEFHEGSVVLSKLSFMKGSAVVAYLCRECKKVIIAYSDEKADLNQR